MEAILAKGAGAAGKVSLEGLEALKGTKFAAQITELAKTTKTAIAETQVPVRATVQTMADTAGGTRKVVNVESKSLGEVFQNLEARAQQVLSGGVEKVKAINLGCSGFGVAVSSRGFLLGGFLSIGRFGSSSSNGGGVSTCRGRAASSAATRRVPAFKNIPPPT